MGALAPGFPELMLPQLHNSVEAFSAIIEWVKGGKAEDLYLDFTRKKNAGSGLLETDDKRAYAKALSGFANSDGGLLVWGVVAEKGKGDPESADVAKRVDPISPLDAFLGELNKVVHYSTKPAVAGVQNIAVPENVGANRGYVVSYVPAGTNPPYHAENDNNNNYYKRAGSSFYRMEPYDIRDVVFRFLYPKLEVEIGYEVLETTVGRDIYTLTISVTNHGPRVLMDYKVHVAIPQLCCQAEAGWVRGPVTVEQPVPLQWLANQWGFLDKTEWVYPGETRAWLSNSFGAHIHYKMNDEAFAAGVSGSRVLCTIYGPDMPPVVSERPFGEMHKYLRR